MIPMSLYESYDPENYGFRDFLSFIWYVQLYNLGFIFIMVSYIMSLGECLRSVGALLLLQIG